MALSFRNHACNLLWPCSLIETSDERFHIWSLERRRISVWSSPTVSLSLQSVLQKFYHNFSPQNNGTHVKVIPQLGVCYSNENKVGRQSKNVSWGREPISVQSAKSVRRKRRKKTTYRSIQTLIGTPLLGLPVVKSKSYQFTPKCDRDQSQRPTWPCIQLLCNRAQQSGIKL